MFERMKMWILAKFSRKDLHVYQMKFAFVSHCLRLRILMGLSTAVSGFLNYKMLFFCSLLSLQNISIPDLPYPENSLITSVIPKHVISALLKSAACCSHPVRLAVLPFLCTAKKCFKIVCRNDHCVLSKYKNILWILLRCLEFCCVCSWIEFIHFMCWTNCPGPQQCKGSMDWPLPLVFPFPPPHKGSMDRIGGKGDPWTWLWKKLHVIFTTLQLKVIIS